jgi:hypothetical protein
MVLGVLSVTLLACFTGLPAIICGHISRSRIERSRGALGGRGLATSGLVMGYLSMVASVVIVLAIWVVASKAPALQAATAGPIVRAQAGKLKTALAKYHSDYGQYPALAPSHGEQVDTAALSRILSGQNPNVTVYYQPGQDGLQVNGVSVDLWFQPLNIAIDLDGDGFVLVGTHKVAGAVAVWSSGPNKQNEFGTGDDVRSW